MTTTSDHSLLEGLAGDDHPQYLNYERFITLLQSTSIAVFSDVDLTDAEDGKPLVYDSSTQTWIVAQEVVVPDDPDDPVTESSSPGEMIPGETSPGV